MDRTIVTLLFLACFAAACGGAQPAPTRAGEYAGPNQLDFLVTAPVQRQMPPERHRGTAVITEDTGERVVMELRMFDGGDVCRLVAVRSGASAPAASDTLAVQPRQQCASRFMYEGSPVAAIVQIEEGTVVVGEHTIAVRLRGGFVADVANAEGVTEIEGIAHWRLDGQR